ETFLMRNARAKGCLEASAADGSVLLEGCNPASAFQHWAWQGDSLLNVGTQGCLSAQEDGTARTGACGGAGWRCSDSLLSPLGGSRGYLVASRRGASLAHTTGPRARWQGAAGSSVCAEKAAEPSRHVPAALASTGVREPAAGNGTRLPGPAPGQLEELLWFFRREDPAAWNYTMVALSFVVLFLGLFLLAVNVVRNRRRKMQVESEHVLEPAELEAKRALVPVQELDRGSPRKQELLPGEEERSGEVLVQWKDGTVTALYAESSEETL
ncbi:OSTB protein, partial [Eudromia elegans]|nr:OSTB protein [Eudromia elegans]